MCGHSRKSRGSWSIPRHVTPFSSRGEEHLREDEETEKKIVRGAGPQALGWIQRGQGGRQEAGPVVPSFTALSRNQALSLSDDEKPLYFTSLLMAGRYEDALRMVQPKRN